MSLTFRLIYKTKRFLNNYNDQLKRTMLLCRLLYPGCCGWLRTAGFFFFFFLFFLYPYSVRVEIKGAALRKKGASPWRPVTHTTNPRSDSAQLWSLDFHSERRRGWKREMRRDETRRAERERERCWRAGTLAVMMRSLILLPAQLYHTALHF